MKRLQQLHDSEINWSLSCFWDGEFTAKLGDEMNGYSQFGVFGNMEDAIQWLSDIAIDVFPESRYAKEVGEIERWNAGVRNRRREEAAKRSKI